MNTHGYRFQDDGHGGSWTAAERGQEQQRRGAAQAAAKAQAEADMQAAITAITSDAALSTQEKLYRLRQLRPSGYSGEEWRLIKNAEASL